jgi:hypothetical protein
MKLEAEFMVDALTTIVAELVPTPKAWSD